MGTESDIDQILKTTKRGAVRSFGKKKRKGFVYLQTEYVHTFSQAVLRTMWQFSDSNVWSAFFVLATPLPGLPVMGIRMAIGRIRIGKVSLACRKTRPYSTAARRHTKDGTIKDLVLSSALCSPAFQHSASVHNSKKLVRVGVWGRGGG